MVWRREEGLATALCVLFEVKGSFGGGGERGEGNGVWIMAFI